MRLMREIRFSVGPEPAGPVLNSWAGWPAATGIQPFIVLRAWVEGEPDPVTGYICNIKKIDGALRECAIPLIRERRGESIEAIIGAVAACLEAGAPPATRWTFFELCPS